MKEAAPAQFEQSEGPKQIIACFYNEGVDDSSFEEITKEKNNNGVQHVFWGNTYRASRHATHLTWW